MQRRQWYIRVNRSKGETTRRSLIDRNLLDRELKILSVDSSLLIPVTEEIEGAESTLFEEFHSKEELPRHEQIGGLAVMAEDSREDAERLLTLRPNLHSVLFAESAVEGEYRIKRFSVLAGIDTTGTIYTEYGHRFKIDLSLAYFSARLSTERQRILSLMRYGEFVVDMFAGVGPFSIILADKADIVYAGDINPEAVALLRENVKLGHVTNVIPILSDACKLPEVVGRIADRIIMNLPLSSDAFLEAAMKIIKPGGTIHCYALVNDENELMESIHKFPVTEVKVKFVRSYSPEKFHVAYDIRV